MFLNYVLYYGYDIIVPVFISSGIGLLVFNIANIVYEELFNRVSFYHLITITVMLKNTSHFFSSICTSLIGLYMKNPTPNRAYNVVMSFSFVYIFLFFMNFWTKYYELKDLKRKKKMNKGGMSM